MEKESQVEKLKTKEQLQQELKEYTAKQVNLCQQEVVAAINPILDKYQCQIDVSVTLRSGQVIPSWNIVPRNVGG